MKCEGSGKGGETREIGDWFGIIGETRYAGESQEAKPKGQVDGRLVRLERLTRLD